MVSNKEETQVPAMELIVTDVHVDDRRQFVKIWADPRGGYNVTINPALPLYIGDDFCEIPIARGIREELATQLFARIDAVIEEVMNSCTENQP
ncbi:hypothetical protein KQI84_18715 [bacterium]|nr:hypothetical protein [bacterium]